MRARDFLGKAPRGMGNYALLITAGERELPIVATLTNRDDHCDACAWPDRCDADRCCWREERLARRDATTHRLAEARAQAEAQAARPRRPTRGATCVCDGCEEPPAGSHGVYCAAHRLEQQRETGRENNRRRQRRRKAKG